MPHSPTRRDPSLPGRWVRCAGVGRGTQGNYLPYVSVTLLPLSWTTFPKFEPILLKNFKMYDCFFYIKIFFFIICVNLLFLLARLISKNDWYIRAHMSSYNCTAYVKRFIFKDNYLSSILPLSSFFGVFAILVRFRATSSISDILCLTFVVRSLREKGRNSEPSSWSSQI